MKDKMSVKVIGIGGMGINFVNFMIASGVRKVEYITIDTDSKNSERSQAEKKIFLDTGVKECSREQAERVALQCESQFRELFKGTDILFLVAGIGGATGSGIMPVILDVSKRLKIFTISIVARPFYLEGFENLKIANTGIKKIEKITDSLIVIPNEKLYNHIDKKEPLEMAYNKVNEIIKEGIESIVNILTEVGFMNIDLLDIKAVLYNSKDTIIRVGEGKGDNAVDEIIEQLKENNLFEGKLENAKKVLINFTAGHDVSLANIGQITEKISDIVKDKNVNLIWGVIMNQDYDKTQKIKTVVISSV
ncbi:cell division protein FtsZ [Leptotrichia sp. oral taxon 879]|uniref:cell division protein FtsZ n=1 Tax=Leptotrichia sp. oral taxon 879 TaxID=1227267 RepID=UPI0003AD821D|nr:cell division protein FtsZ [Leptotrichia sp. oral taxon 879]ERK53390.1 putative cell division protein FtsZ [Leptotrichia sp. oral taxon 879 str. F0557]